MMQTFCIHFHDAWVKWWKIHQLIFCQSTCQLFSQPTNQPLFQMYVFILWSPKVSSSNYLFWSDTEKALNLPSLQIKRNPQLIFLNYLGANFSHFSWKWSRCCWLIFCCRVNCRLISALIARHTKKIKGRFEWKNMKCVECNQQNR